LTRPTMESSPWTIVLSAALGLNAVLGFFYRVYRLSRGGPMGDVVGQGILGILLIGLALLVAAGAGWARWISLAYALLFGVVVMPVWILAVLIPLRPGRIDKAFTIVYWVTLGAVALAAILI
jgi:hypothetical protein